MEVVVIDGRDLASPEHQAMLAALYSRNPTSVKIHMEQVRQRGADRFLSQWYVNYGHKSIGDCGTTSIFIENVSILAAKAIQDTPLYNGQEASTRYLDMAAREVVNPLGTEEGRRIQTGWMALYTYVLERLIPDLKARFPKKEDEKDSVWEKAIKARAFDIARGFLPAGTTTFVAWHTNLRQAHDHLSLLRHHPTYEVREIATEVHKQLLKRYPSSFGHKTYDATEAYLAESEAQFAYFDDYPVTNFSYTNRLNTSALSRFYKLLSTRPPKTELHHRMRRFGSIDFEFPLDFGSYRDLQRQRSAVQEMPLLTTKYGFYPWYLAQLPDDVRAQVVIQVNELEYLISKLDTDDVTKQYYTAIGYTVPVVMSCSLPSAVYIAELRSGQTVHPTLRIRAQEMGEAIKECVPGIAMHHDMTPDEWSIKRGTQDIVKR